MSEHCHEQYLRSMRAADQAAKDGDMVTARAHRLRAMHLLAAEEEAALAPTSILHACGHTVVYEMAARDLPEDATPDRLCEICANGPNLLGEVRADAPSPPPRAGPRDAD